MRILAILACVAVTACANVDGPNLTQVMERCDYDAKPFVQAWPCVRTGFQKVDFYSDLKSLYIASGDFVSEQVTTGKMTDAEARLAMAQVRQRNRESAENRERRNPVADAIVVSSVLNRPNAFASTGPVMQAPAVPLNCYRFGSSVQCN
jgi:hypothetical protein